MGDVLLVVDDDAMNRDMLSRRLQREGFEVLVAEGGREALEVLSSQRVDLLLLDLMMPEVSGLDVLAEVRRQRSATELPVIMVSAASDSSAIVEALNLGANDYVTKPVNLPVALARVQSQLARRREAGTPAALQVEPGAMVNQYRVEALLGKGGMASVYRALDTRLDRPVALKVLSAEAGLTSLQIERFTREARASARVRHPGVVAVYEVASTPCHYIAMELVRGETLDRFLDHRPLPPRRAAVLLRGIASALAEVHEHGILHRDLKPSNIMVDEAGAVHLTDFGLAKVIEGELDLTRSGTLLGTPQYMAPELVDGTLGSVGERTDLYALGLILHELLTGEPALQGRTLASLLYEILNREPQAPSELNPEVPRELDELCLGLQARDPRDRPASAREVVQALERYLAG